MLQKVVAAAVSNLGPLSAQPIQLYYGFHLLPHFFLPPVFSLS